MRLLRVLLSVLVLLEAPQLLEVLEFLLLDRLLGFLPDKVPDKQTWKKL